MGAQQGATPPRVHNPTKQQEEEADSPPDLINRGLDEDSDSDSEEEEDAPAEKIVAWPRPAIVASVDTKSTPFPLQNMPNYITQDESPADNTRARTRKRETIMRVSDEVMLSCIQMSQDVKVNPRSAASKKYPIQLLCDLAGAVLDQDTGDLLEYRHLLNSPKYREIWGRGHAKEVGRLAQGLPGIVQGTDTIKFIEKEDIPVE